MSCRKKQPNASPDVEGLTRAWTDQLTLIGPKAGPEKKTSRFDPKGDNSSGTRSFQGGKGLTQVRGMRGGASASSNSVRRPPPKRVWGTPSQPQAREPSSSSGSYQDDDASESTSERPMEATAKVFSTTLQDRFLGLVKSPPSDEEVVRRIRSLYILMVEIGEASQTTVDAYERWKDGLNEDLKRLVGQLDRPDARPSSESGASSTIFRPTTRTRRRNVIVDDDSTDSDVPPFFASQTYTPGVYHKGVDQFTNERESIQQYFVEKSHLSRMDLAQLGKETRVRIAYALESDNLDWEENPSNYGGTCECCQQPEKNQSYKITIGNQTWKVGSTCIKQIELIDEFWNMVITQQKDHPDDPDRDGPQEFFMTQFTLPYSTLYAKNVVNMR